MQLCEIIPNCVSIEDMCDYDEHCCNLNYFGWNKPGIAKNIMLLILSGFISWFSLFVIEFKVFWKIKYILGKKKIQTRDYSSLDKDVVSEIKRIENMKPTEIMKNHLVMRAMTKKFNKFVAVKDLSLGVES